MICSDGKNIKIKQKYLHVFSQIPYIQGVNRQPLWTWREGGNLKGSGVEMS
jgi:hypothetical protein